MSVVRVRAADLRPGDRLPRGRIAGETVASSEHYTTVITPGGGLLHYRSEREVAVQRRGARRRRVAERVRCAGCGHRWTGADACHCDGCHWTFASVAAFDRHRFDGMCCDPASLGLVRVAGCWGLR